MSLVAHMDGTVEVSRHVKGAFDLAQARCDRGRLVDDLTTLLLPFDFDDETQRFMKAILTTAIVGRDEGFFWTERSRVWIVRVASEAARNPDMRAAFLTVLAATFYSTPSRLQLLETFVPFDGPGGAP